MFFTRKNYLLYTWVKARLVHKYISTNKWTTSVQVHFTPIWNSLPNSVVMADLINSFKSHLVIA